MATFAYTYRTPSGSSAKGKVEAPNRQAASGKLKAQGLIITSLNEAKGGGFDFSALRSKLGLGGKVSLKALVLFTRQFSTLVTAGIPIVRGLEVLVEQIEKKKFKEIVANVRTDISRGASITAALEKYPQAFDQLYISMVKAGEIGGVLDEVLQRLADQLEKLAELRRKIKGAMVYPAVVIVFSGGIVAFLLTFVIPVFATMFEGFGSELPAATRMLIFASDILKNQFLYVLVITIVSIVAFRLWVRTPAGELIFDTYLLKLPVFGPLFRKVAIAKFSRTLGALVRSGVPILEALEIVARGSGNKLVENAVMDARSAIRGGERISDPLGKSGIFPPMVIQMIAVGEESGTLDSMLNKVADFYDSEVDAAVAALASAIEPIIIVVLGIIVLFVMIALFMPMFDIAGAIE